MLSSNEQIRYLRQLILANFDTNSQLKLKNAKAFIVGAGGLGSPVALYLAAAGVGKIVLCDHDTVELSNLNRQILHFTNDIGIPKSVSALQKINKLNPEINIEAYQISITNENINNYAKNADIIIDCLDNIKTRLILNKFSIANKIPIVHGGVNGWNGQITILHPPDTACMQCLFEDYKDTNDSKPIIGAVAGIVGTHQALATIKYLAGIETGLYKQLLFFDGMAMEWTKVPIEKNASCACNKHYINQ